MRQLTTFCLVGLSAAILCIDDNADAQGGADTIRQRVQALERAGRFAETISLYEEWHRLAPEQAPVTRGHARALAAIGAHQRVIDLLERWLKKRRDNPAALLLGDAYHELNQLDKAVASWRRAIDKNSAASYGPVADRCRGAGLRREAIRILREGQKVHGGESAAGLYSWELAALYLEEGDYRPALEMFLANIRQTPQRLPVVAGRLETICRTDGAEVLETLQALAATEPFFAAQLSASCALAAGDPESGLAALADLEGQAAEHDVSHPAHWPHAARCGSTLTSCARAHQ